MSKNLICFLIVGSALLSLPQGSLAQSQPQTLEEAKSFGWEILNRLPEAVKSVWENQAKPVLLETWVWFKEFWSTYIGPKASVLWDKALSWFGKEPTDVKEEFQKEKTELQNDLWERFKDLFH